MGGITKLELYKKHWLHPYWLTKLEEIGFVWSINKINAENETHTMCIRFGKIYTL
jgi:hypothetical protein